MQNQIIQGDRRSDQRYNLALELRYWIRTQGGLVRMGRGATRNISSRGLMVETGEALLPGEELDLVVDWPIKLENLYPLELRVSGRVLRITPAGTVLKISRCEFRIRGTRDEPSLAMPPARPADTSRSGTARLIVFGN